MIRALTATVALLCALWASPAAAERAKWGFVVNDENEEYVGSGWPQQSTVILGSNSSCFYVLSDLAGEHIEISFTSLGFAVTPRQGAAVFVAGERITATTIVDDDDVTIGRYTLRLFEADDQPAEEPSEQYEIDPEEIAEEHLRSPPPFPPVDPVDAAEKGMHARIEELGRSAYEFCHDEDFGRSGTDGREFCAIFDESTDDACPKARQSCSGWIDHAGARLDLERRGSSGERRASIRAIEIPPVIAYGVLAVLVGFILFFFIRAFLSAGWEKEAEEGAADPQIDDSARNFQSLPEARSTTLLDLADRALARGDTEEAAVILHLAVLRHLEDEGLARYHRSKTNGDYLRAIRSIRPLAELFRGAARQTERSRFGDGVVDAAVVASLLVDARSLLIRGSGRPRVAAPAVLALLALGALSSQSCADADPSHAFHSHGPTGMAALPVILRKAGMEVKVTYARFADLGPEVGAVVFRTSASRTNAWPSELDLDQLFDRELSVVVIDDIGHSDFFLPVNVVPPVDQTAKTVTMPSAHMTICGYLAKEETAGTARIPNGPRLVGLAATTDSSTISKYPLVLEPLIIHHEDHDQGLLTPSVALAAQRNKDGTPSGCLYLFQGRDLFTNASLTRADNSRFVTSFFASLVTEGHSIAIVDRLDDYTSSDAERSEAEKPPPTKALSASNMLAFLIQGLLALAVLYVFLGAAFGPLRDPVRTTHKAFVEHVEAIGRQYARTGTAGKTHAAESLARLVVAQNRDRLRGGAGSGWASLASDLAQKHGLREEEVRAALRLGIEGVSELGAPGPNDPAPSSHQMLSTLSRLLGSRNEGGDRHRRGGVKKWT